MARDPDLNTAMSHAKTPAPRIWPTLVAGLALAAQGPAQEQRDWRLPFRSPQANLVPPEAMYEHLRPMFQIAQQAPREQKRFDSNGAEVVDDPIWQQHYEKLVGMYQDAGYLSSVIRDSQHVLDRRIAFYAAFFVPDEDHVFNLIGHIPGEPVRELREEAFARAVEYLAVQLPRKNPGDLAHWSTIEVGPAGEKPPRPGEFTFDLDPVPFVALLGTKEDIDKRQVLWFFARCVEIRPAYALVVLERCRPTLRAIAAGPPSKLRDSLRDLCEQMDPDSEREAPATDAPGSKVRDWLDAIDHALLPPIRPVSSGLVELYPSDDLDRIVRVGRAHLENGQAGSPRNGKTDQGGFYRGLRIAELPEPLDLLRIPAGTVITAVNGSPVADCAGLLKLLDRMLPATRSLLVEFVDEKGHVGAIEFRRR